MAVIDAAVGQKVEAFPHVYLWNVSAVSEGGDNKVRIYNAPVGKKIVLAKLWIHSLTAAAVSITFFRGLNLATTELTESLAQANIHFTSGAIFEDGHIDAEQHYKIAVGGADSEDLLIQYGSNNETCVLSVQLFVIDS